MKLEYLQERNNETIKDKVNDTTLFDKVLN